MGSTETKYYEQFKKLYTCSSRHNCSSCNENYDLDNMNICVDCGRVYCYQCVWKLKKSNAVEHNFSHLCPCGGLVGSV